MRFPWLQVDADFIAARSRDFASLLPPIPLSEVAGTTRPVSRHEAMGMMLDLWSWVLGRTAQDSPPTGLVSGINAPRLVAGAADWRGGPGLFVEALVGAGLAEWGQSGVRLKGLDRYGHTWAKNSRVRVRPELAEWYQQNPGVPPPRGPLPDGIDLPPIALRLRTPEERAAYMAEQEARLAPIRAAQAEQRRLRARRWVYFMQERGNASAPIKIGISRDVERRRGELQRAEGVILQVLATMEGTVKDEGALHARFAACRLHGEWFSPAPEILAHVALLNGVKGAS